MMEGYLNENFEVKSKHSSEEALQRWRKLCGVVKNPRRRFRFTANLVMRGKAAAMRRTNQVSIFIHRIWMLKSYFRFYAQKEFFFFFY